MNETKSEIPLVHLTINGKQLSVPKGTTVYNAAKQAGIDIPIFCYQDRMPPFGACRMCLVEVEKMAKLQTSCTLEVSEGMIVKTNSERAKGGQDEILELLLINHPLDCPICDKGGECPLQDQTMKFGPERSRFYEEKRHWKKSISLGPVLTLDRERCVMCARCTRFGEIVAGDHALEIHDRGFKSEIGASKGDIADSKFIGNTIMICPVGALTSTVYRFRARPWDNDSTPSTCTLCPVGCSMIWDARDGEIMRTRSCENKGVNDIWLCDKGWFGYEFTDHNERLKTPLIRRNGVLELATWDEALTLIAQKIDHFKPNGKLAAFGGNPLTLEENYLFQKLMREGADSNHLDYRIGMPLINADEEGFPPGMEISIGDCESLSYAFLLGIDITEEYPVIWLRLKQGINHGAKVIFSGHYLPEVSSYFTKSTLHSSSDTLKAIQQQFQEWNHFITDPQKKSAIFIGQQYLSSPHRHAILSELLKLKKVAPHLSINLMEAKENSLGARLAGMRPDFGPLDKAIAEPGLNALQVLEAAAEKGWDLLYVAGANPAVKFPSNLWKKARSKMNFMVVQDLFLTETAKEADLVLPALSYAEKGGSFINIEGRIQKLTPGKTITPGLYGDGEIFTLIANKLSLDLSLDDEFAQFCSLGFCLSPNDDLNLTKISPDVSSLGFSLSKKTNTLLSCFAPILFDRGVRMQHNPHLSKLIKEPFVRIHSNEGKKRNLADKSSIKLCANGATIHATLKWDDNIAEGTILLPMGFAELPVQDLSLNWMNGLPIEVSNNGV